MSGDTLILRGKWESDIESGLRGVKDAAQGMGNAVRDSVSVVTPEVKKLEASLQDNIFRLQAQKELLSDPVYQQSARQAAQLRAEVNELTASTMRDTEATTLNVRSRREMMVMVHEAALGRYKNLGASAMVLEEGAGGITGALQAVVAMMGGPVVAASAAAALATVGVGAALWSASEAAAENYHKMTLLGTSVGMTAQEMMGMQYMTIGTSVTTEELARSIQRFTVNLSRHREEMAALGVTAKDPMDAFEQFMDLLNRTSDASDRNALAQKMLGREWGKLDPVLRQGGAAAKEATAAMKLDPETIEDYKRANEAQITIDKAWMSITLHTGEALAGMRAYFKEHEARILSSSAKNMADPKIGAFWGFLSGFTPAGQLRATRTAQDEEENKNPTDFRSSHAKALSEDAIKDADKNRKEIIKNSLAEALKEENEGYGKERIEFAGHAKEMEEAETAHRQRLADIRARFAKRDHHSDHHSAFDMRVDENVRRTGSNSVELRDDRGFAGQSIAKELDGMRKKDIETSERDKKKTDDQMRKRIASLQGENDKLSLQLKGVSDGKSGEIRSEYATKINSEPNAEAKILLQKQEALRLAVQEAEVRKRSAEEQSKAINSASATAASMITQMLNSTKSLSAMMHTMLTDMEAKLEQRGIQSFLNSVLGGTSTASSIFGIGAASSSGGTSAIVPFLTSIFGGHAGGGIKSGGGMIGERGPEYMVANTPSRVYSNTQSTSIGSVTIHVSGGGSASATANAVAEVLSRAGGLNISNRRQTSR